MATDAGPDGPIENVRHGRGSACGKSPARPPAATGRALRVATTSQHSCVIAVVYGDGTNPCHRAPQPTLLRGACGQVVDAEGAVSPSVVGGADGEGLQKSLVFAAASMHTSRPYLALGARGERNR